MLALVAALSPGAAVVGARLTVKVSESSPFSGCSVGADAATNHLNADVEPQIAANPTTLRSGAVNLVAVWQQDRWDDGGAHGIAAAASFDGGATWTETALPFTLCSASGLPFDRASDPWVSFGPDGTAYVSALVDTMGVQGPQLAGIVTAVSHDDGKTWTHVQAIDRQEDDKPSITADPSKPGVAYAVWDRADTGVFARTTDGGVTWSKARVIVGSTAHPLATTGHQVVVDRKRHALDDIFGVYGTKAVHKTVCHEGPGGKKTCHTTVGNLLVVIVHPANISDRDGADWVLEAAVEKSGRLRMSGRIAATPGTLWSGGRPSMASPSRSLASSRGSIPLWWRRGGGSWSRHSRTSAERDA
jgi:hypothetical protein